MLNLIQLLFVRVESIGSTRLFLNKESDAMRKYPRMILLGFLTWLIPFLVAIIIFPLRTSQRLLFESIMPNIVVVCAVFFSITYFRRQEVNCLKEGMIIGGVWFTINIGLDLLLFMEGPMKMSISDYMKDIGLTYLIIPIVTVGFGYLLEQRKRRSA